MSTPIKQIQTTDNVVHDIQGIEFITGTQTTSTNEWKGVTQVDELYHGMVINYKLPYAGTTNTNPNTGQTTCSTLELFDSDGNSLGAHPVYRNANTTITTHYPVNSVIRLVYDGNATGTQGSMNYTGAWKTADYDANTTTTVQQAPTTTNAYYPVIHKLATTTAKITTSVAFNTKFLVNASNGALKLNTTQLNPASSAATLTFPSGTGTLALEGHTHTWGDITNPPASYTPTSHTHSASDISGISDYANQNAFSNIKVGSTTIVADSITDTVEFVGSNVTITPDAANDKVTFGITSANVTSALGYSPSVVTVQTANVGFAAGTITVNNQTYNLKVPSIDIESDDNNTYDILAYEGSAPTDIIRYTTTMQMGRNKLKVDNKVYTFPSTGGTLALEGHTHTWTDVKNAPTAYTPTAHTHTIGQVYNGNSALSVNSSSTNVKMDGTASAGSGSALALANHIHPTDTSRAPIDSPAFTGYPTLANAPSVTMGVANKGYVDGLIGGITSFDYAVTSTLPASGTKGTIYLVGHTHGTNDIYDEYIYANNTWEKIGNTDIDLTNYSQVGHTHDYSKVSATSNLSSGITIGAITVDGATSTLYAPEQVQVDWDDADSSSVSYILNKPDAYTPTSHTHSTTVAEVVKDIDSSTVTVITSYPGSTSKLSTTSIYPAADVTAVTQINSSSDTVYSAASGQFLTSATGVTTSIYPAANLNAVTGVQAFTTSIYPASDISAVTNISKTTTTVYGTDSTTVYGSGQQSNVMSAPTVINGVLSWTLVTTSNGTSVSVANGTSTTVVNDVSYNTSSVRGDSTTVATGSLQVTKTSVRDSSVTVGTGAIETESSSVRDEGISVITSIDPTTTSIRGSSLTVATGDVTTTATGGTVLVGLGTPDTEVVSAGVTATYRDVIVAVSSNTDGQIM